MHANTHVRSSVGRFRHAVSVAVLVGACLSLAADFTYCVLLSCGYLKCLSSADGITLSYFCPSWRVQRQERARDNLRA